MRHLDLPELALPLATLILLFMLADCFSHNLFGGGPEITYSGVDPNTPIPDPTPGENDSPALTRGRKITDGGTDGGLR